MKQANQQLPAEQGALSEQKVIYVAPPIEQIEQCARQICQSLGKTLDPKYDALDTQAGLTAFLKVVADMEATHLNKQAERETSFVNEKPNK